MQPETKAAPGAGGRLGADRPAGQYVPVPLGAVRPYTLAPVDLYIRHGPGGQPVLYKAAEQPLTEQVRVRLVRRGVDCLYARMTDEDAYLDYVEEHIDAIVRDDLAPRPVACDLVYRSSARVTRALMADPRSGRNLARVHRIVATTTHAILEDPESIWHLAAVASHDYYTYTHCVQVGVLLVGASYFVLGIRDEKALSEIGAGGFMHDVGKSQIPERILTKPGRLTDGEFARVRQHPVLGARIVADDREATAVTAGIVLGHHEHMDGSGYPSGLVGPALQRVQRLANVVDVYDALTTNRPYAGARSPFDALRIMTGGMVEQFDRELLNAFVRFLGPGYMRAALREQSEGLAVGPAQGPAGA